MKAKQLLRVGALAACGVLPMLTAGCDLSGLDELGEGVGLIIEIPPVETMVSGSIVNAATGELMSQPVLLTISGPDRADVVDALLLEPVEQTTLNAGSLTLSLKRGVRPSVADPVEFVVEAQASGFVPASTPVRLTAEGDFSFSLKLVELNRAPEGVSVRYAVEGQAGSGGVMASPVSVATAAAAGAQGTAAVELPADTRVTTLSGEPVSGPLAISMAYHSNQTEASIASFPGGVGSASIETGSGREQAAFVTAGFLNVVMRDGQGRTAERFSPALELTFDVPAALRNPETGASLQPGDVIPAWSFSTATGAWKQEGQAVVGELKPNGFYSARFKAAHLSVWNLGWRQQSCTVPAKINIVGNTASLPLNIRVTNRSANHTSEQLAWQFFDQGAGKTRTFVNRPLQSVSMSGFASASATWEIAAYHGEARVGQTIYTGNLCGATVDLPVAVDPSRYVEVALNGTVRCDVREPRLNYPFRYRRTGTRSWQAWLPGYFASSSTVVYGMQKDAEYEVELTYTRQSGGTFTERQTFTLTPGEVPSIDGVSVREESGRIVVEVKYIDQPDICAEL